MKAIPSPYNSFTHFFVVSSQRHDSGFLRVGAIGTAPPLHHIMQTRGGTPSLAGLYPAPLASYCSSPCSATIFARTTGQSCICAP